MYLITDFLEAFRTVNDCNPELLSGYRHRRFLEPAQAPYGSNIPICGFFSGQRFISKRRAASITPPVTPKMVAAPEDSPITVPFSVGKRPKVYSRLLD